MSTSNILRAAVATLSIVIAVPAFAQDREPVQKRVAYADLDLSTPAGQAALRQRIHKAASLACQSSLDGIKAAQDRSQCMREMQKDGQLQLASLVSDRGLQLAAVAPSAKPTH
jgi:UrcA family protein